MSEKDFHRYWFIGGFLATTVVAVVAALVLAIISTARTILANAGRALGLVNEIVTTTAPIWELDTTNAVVGQLVEGARAINRHATQVADALAGPDPYPAPVKEPEL